MVYSCLVHAQSSAPREITSLSDNHIRPVCDGCGRACSPNVGFYKVCKKISCRVLVLDFWWRFPSGKGAPGGARGLGMLAPRILQCIRAMFSCFCKTKSCCNMKDSGVKNNLVFYTVTKGDWEFKIPVSTVNDPSGPRSMNKVCQALKDYGLADQDDIIKTYKGLLLKQNYGHDMILLEDKEKPGPLKLHIQRKPWLNQTEKMHASGSQLNIMSQAFFTRGTFSVRLDCLWNAYVSIGWPATFEQETRIRESSRARWHASLSLQSFAR